MSIANVQMIYGGISAFAALLFLVFAREKPATPPCPDGEETRALMLEGLKNALSNRMFWLILFISFLGMAIFNGVTTWVENIVRPRGFHLLRRGHVWRIDAGRRDLRCDSAAILFGQAA